jgi:hemolysin activation/secretion protein
LDFQLNVSHAEPPVLLPDAISIEKPRLPDIKPEALPRKPEFSLPALKTSPEKDPKLSSAFSVFIKQIILTGNTVFSDQELKTITQIYENRTVSNQELQSLKHQLTQYYIDHGYINSGIILPDQQVKDGIINMQVIEGKLTEFEISGNNWLHSSYIDDRIKQSFAPPLNIKDVQNSLLLLQQDPLIERINAELLPGSKPGQSRT